jgi:biotin carboxylase
MQNPQVAVVDCFGTSFGYRDVFADAGCGVIQVQSTAELPFGVEPAPEDAFSRVLVAHDDIDLIAEKLAELRPLAVLPGRETGVELADTLSERLGLPSNGTALSSARRDKYLQIERLRECGVPAYEQIRTDDEDELRSWHRRLGGTTVVKPLRSYWGDGISFCESPDQSAAALRRIVGTRAVSGEHNTHVVGQEYLVGAEYIVNTVSCEGVHQLTDVWRTGRITANGVRDLAIEQILMRPDEEPASELAQYAFRVLDALGIRYGAAHLEIKATPDGPRLVELGARLSGLPYYVGEVLGEGQLEWTLDAYLRPERFHERVGRSYVRRHAFAWAALISPASGRLVRYRALDEVRALESFRDLTLVVEPGARIETTVNDWGFPATLTLAHPVEAVMRRDLNTLRYLDGVGMYEIAPGY